MTALTEFTEPENEMTGIYRREDTWLAKTCSYCGDNVPARYWVLDICRGRLVEASPRRTTLRLDAQVQLRQTCCADHAVKDLAVFLGQSGIRLAPPGADAIVPCARCGIDIIRALPHYSLWAALIEDGDIFDIESHNHATLCRLCAEQVGSFTAEELDEAVAEDGHGDEPAEYESVGARYA